MQESQKRFSLYRCGLALLVLAVSISSTASQTPELSRQLPTGIPTAVWKKRIPNRTSIQSQKIALGEALFFDKRLSANGTMSCATCHDPAMAFAGTDPIAVGNAKGTRNAPTLLNAVFADTYFWDGRVQTLEEQAKQPLLNLAEMGMTSENALVQRLSSITEYRSRFRRVFGPAAISLETIAKAIAAYERTLISANSPFDRFIAGDSHALTDAQKRGWALFKGKAKCIDCHAYTRTSPFFTDFAYHNTGIGVDPAAFNSLEQSAQTVMENRDASEISQLAHKPLFSQLGRFLVTRKWEDLAAFKTPTLRDVELTRPYMHDGSFGTLLDVVRFYNRGGTKNRMLDKKVNPLDLTEQEMSEVVEFLRALTSNDVLHLTQFSKPQTRERVSLP